MESGYPTPSPTPPPPSQPPDVRFSPNPQSPPPKKPIYKRWWFIVGAIPYGIILLASSERIGLDVVRLLVVGGFVYASYWLIEQKTRIKPWAKHLIVVPASFVVLAVLIAATETTAEKAERERLGEARIAKEEANRVQQPSPSSSTKSPPQLAPEPPSKNAVLDDHAIKIAQIMTFDAHFDAALGQSDLVPMSQSEALSNLKIEYALDARRLAREYDANEVAADMKYKRKRVLVAGTVSSINKDILNSPFVTLVGYEASDLNASFSRSDAGTLASLKKGQSVSFVCDASGLSVGDVMLTDCSTFGTYANTLRSDIAGGVADALNGSVPVSQAEAQRIARTYVIAAYFANTLPQNSSCFRTEDSACIDQMNAVNKTFQKTNKTDAWKKDSAAKIDSLIAKMKVIN